MRFAAVRTTRAAVPHLLERGQATIVTICSVNAVLPDPTKLDWWDLDQNFYGLWATYKPKKGTTRDFYVLNLAQNLHKQASRRVGTPDLNRVLRQAVEEQPPPMRLNRRPKITFAIQVSTNPPTIVPITV